MNAKQEAKELVDKFNNITLNNGSVNNPNLEITQISLRLRKQCALICVNAMIEEIINTDKERYNYLCDVRQELNKL